MKYQVLSTYWQKIIAMIIVAIPFMAHLFSWHQDWSEKLRPFKKGIHFITSMLGWAGAALGYQWDVPQVVTAFVRVHGHLDLLWQYITTATM